MKKRLKLLVTLICLSALVLTLTACAPKTKDQEMADRGYVISVTYHANGGKFLNREGITVKDYFNPNSFEKAPDGSVSIKIMEPTDKSRPTSGQDPIYLGRDMYSCIGWYKECKLVEVDGNPVDKYGQPLTKTEDGDYVLKSDGETAADPMYEYSGRWDFNNDAISYKNGDGVVAINLYAAWIPQYEFQYYFMVDGAWTLVSTTTFDYNTAKADGSDADVIWLPQWGESAVNYKSKYADGSTYTFPSVKNTTFVKAYLDEACTQEITTAEFEHQGTVDLATGTPVNRIQKIYVQTEEGERYKIATAQQLLDNVNLNGWYEIQNDIDFTGVKWPAGFATGTFAGKIYGKDDAVVTIKNLVAEVNNDSARFGGIFGNLASGAEIKNVNFENATVDLMSVNGKERDAAFGLFAGYVEDGATVQNVTVSGTLKIGNIMPADGYSFNVVANSDKEIAVTKGEITVIAYGKEFGTGAAAYRTYTFDASTVYIDAETDDILGFVFKNIRDRDNENPKPLTVIITYSGTNN